MSESIALTFFVLFMYGAAIIAVLRYNVIQILFKSDKFGDQGNIVGMVLGAAITFIVFPLLLKGPDTSKNHPSKQIQNNDCPDGKNKTSEKECFLEK